MEGRDYLAFALQMFERYLLKSPLLFLPIVVSLSWRLLTASLLSKMKYLVKDTKITYVGKTRHKKKQNKFLVRTKFRNSFKKLKFIPNFFLENTSNKRM